MKQYRVEPQFSIDPNTGFPKNDYVVQWRRFGKWLTIASLGVFGTPDKAFVAKERLERDELLRREEDARSRRDRMKNRGRR